MIRSYIERVVLSVLNGPRLRESIPVENGPYGRPPTLERAIGDNAPMAIVYRISNGFISVVHSNDGRLPTITFCKDGEEISQAVVAQAVKDKIGIGAAGQTLGAHVSVSGGGGGINISRSPRI